MGHLKSDNPGPRSNNFLPPTSRNNERFFGRFILNTSGTQGTLAPLEQDDATTCYCHECVVLLYVFVYRLVNMRRGVLDNKQERTQGRKAQTSNIIAAKVLSPLPGQLPNGTTK